MIRTDELRGIIAKRNTSQRAIAKAIRNGKEKRRIKKLAEDKSAKEEWVYVNRSDYDEEAFMKEMEADAAEAEQLMLTGGEINE